MEDQTENMMGESWRGHPRQDSLPQSAPRLTALASGCCAGTDVVQQQGRRLARRQPGAPTIQCSLTFRDLGYDETSSVAPLRSPAAFTSAAQGEGEGQGQA